MIYHQEIIRQLLDGTFDINKITDEDMRHLIIAYAIVVRDPAVTQEKKNAVMDEWSQWPCEFFKRFGKMISEGRPMSVGRYVEAFWDRPSEIVLAFKHT
jgi:hypothetical protein